MKAEILAVGTEILLGDILNTNAQYLSKKLAQLGIEVYFQGVVGDNEDRLKEALELSFKRADLVITTGGLGPTKDDLTKETIFDFFHKPSVIHEKSLNSIKEYFKKSNREMPDNNIKQAYFPEDAIIMENNNGTAPGCILESKGKIIGVFPGPPKELVPMFEESFLPYIKKFTKGVLYSKVLRVAGLGESKACEIIQDILDEQNNPTIAPYAKDTEVTFRITAKANTEVEAKKIIEPLEKKVRERLGENVYGVGNTSIEDETAKLLIKNNLTIAVAESCTGGLLAGKLINYPGISSVFMDGVVSYSNESKMKRLGVKEETLDKYGAVSKEVAMEMAEGVSKTMETKVGISTTGIAGPTGGSPEKPVGLVYVGLYIEGKTSYIRLNLNGNRQKVRDLAVNKAINYLRRNILER
ncbi:competence/damage-inducible protein A [Haloimpatiens sp. FM7315]|uniref:competence/damage-inducible protein A n=1 Tax=Haloimpatiens sp. FM7315 TaxID=3298609 RepID=UPI0035A3722B